MTTNPTVYLAGPITGLGWGTATDWRDHAVERLASCDITGFSPLRSKEYLQQETTLGDQYAEFVLSSQKGITTCDRFDAQRCDLLLVNVLGAERVSIGTMIELGWADSVKTPIVLVMEEGNLHDHAMVRELAGWIVEDLDKGLAVCEAVLTLNPGRVDRG